jgi:hypothetical protein
MVFGITKKVSKESPEEITPVAALKFNGVRICLTVLFYPKK